LGKPEVQERTIQYIKYIDGKEKKRGENPIHKFGKIKRCCIAHSPRFSRRWWWFHHIGPHKMPCIGGKSIFPNPPASNRVCYLKSLATSWCFLSLSNKKWDNPINLRITFFILGLINIQIKLYNTSKDVENPFILETQELLKILYIYNYTTPQICIYIYTVYILYMYICI
jgi:hypothetical protein